MIRYYSIGSWKSTESGEFWLCFYSRNQTAEISRWLNTNTCTSAEIFPVNKHEHLVKCWDFPEIELMHLFLCWVVWVSGKLHLWTCWAIWFVEHAQLQRFRYGVSVAMPLHSNGIMWETPYLQQRLTIVVRVSSFKGYVLAWQDWRNTIYTTTPDHLMGN